MIKEILTLGSFFLAGILFVYLRGKLTKQVKPIAKKTIEDIVESDVINYYKGKAKEKFNPKKLKKLFVLNDKVEWIKSIKEILDLRKLVILGLIISCIYGYGWYKGTQGKPVQFNLAYDKAFKIKLDGHYLVKEKNTHTLEIQNPKGDKIKTIKVKDLPALQEKLKPIGFELNPIGIMGYGTGEHSYGFEAGAGVSFLRFYSWKLDSFLTQKGIYLGTSYNLHKIGMENSSLGIAGGKGYKGDNRTLLYYKWEF